MKIKIVPLIISAIFSISLTNFGVILIRELPKNYYLGVSLIIIAFMILYLSDKLIQIKENKDKIKELEEELEKINERIEIQEKLLNTINNIVSLKGIYKNGKTANKR